MSGGNWRRDVSIYLEREVLSVRWVLNLMLTVRLGLYRRLEMMIRVLLRESFLSVDMIGLDGRIDL